MSYKKDYSQTSDRHGFFDYDFHHHQHGEHGGYSGGGGDELCCPLVADPLTVFTLLSFIAFATAFLNVLVTMNIMMRRRRRRKRDDSVGCEDDQGKVVWQQAMDAFHGGTERLLIGQISNWGSEKSM